MCVCVGVDDRFRIVLQKIKGGGGAQGAFVSVCSALLVISLACCLIVFNCFMLVLDLKSDFIFLHHLLYSSFFFAKSLPCFGFKNT